MRKKNEPKKEKSGEELFFKLLTWIALGISAALGLTLILYIFLKTEFHNPLTILVLIYITTLFYSLYSEFHALSLIFRFKIYLRLITRPISNKRKKIRDFFSYLIILIVIWFLTPNISSVPIPLNLRLLLVGLMTLILIGGDLLIFFIKNRLYYTRIMRKITAPYILAGFRKSVEWYYEFDQTKKKEMLKPIEQESRRRKFLRLFPYYKDLYNFEYFLDYYLYYKNRFELIHAVVEYLDIQFITRYNQTIQNNGEVILKLSKIDLAEKFDVLTFVFKEPLNIISEFGIILKKKNNWKLIIAFTGFLLSNIIWPIIHLVF